MSLLSHSLSLWLSLSLSWTFQCIWLQKSINPGFKIRYHLWKSSTFLSPCICYLHCWKGWFCVVIFILFYSPIQQVVLLSVYLSRCFLLISSVKWLSFQNSKKQLVIPLLCGISVEIQATMFCLPAAYVPHMKCAELSSVFCIQSKYKSLLWH